jgi:antitoxin component YwqK of YwqJK toxin-antitoxin module
MNKISIFFVVITVVLLGLLANFTYREVNLRDGLVQEHFPVTGELRSEVFYKNGKPDGVAKVYYRNGQLKRETEFVNGVQRGKCVGYYENGKIASEEIYDDTKLEGHAKYYDATGKLKWEADFAKGKMVAGTRKDHTN